MSLQADVRRIRAFNRFYTARIGVLLDRPYDENFSLAETRVLFELAHAAELQPAALARELGLDPAYLSRILARFQRLKLIQRLPDQNDRRATRVKLTGKGREVFAPMDQASERKVSELLGALSAEGRREVVAAAAALQTNLGASPTPAPARLRDLACGDIGWITHRQGVIYDQEFGWDLSYEALVAVILGEFVRTFDASRERAWIAEREGEIVGSVFLVRDKAPDTARLRLLYVEPSCRGAGLGARLVNECIEAARQFGYRSLVLWTNDVLAAARRIYEATGFELVERKPHHSFGQDLVGETWRLTL